MIKLKRFFPIRVKDQGIWLLMVLLLFSPFLAGGEPALEIRTSPEKRVYLFETNSRRGYYNLLIQNIICLNRSGASVTLEKLVIEPVDDQQVLQSVYTSRRDLEQSAGRMQAFESKGLLKLYDPFLGISRMMKEGDRLSPSTELQPNTGILSMWHYLTFRGMPDGVIIRFSGKRPDGKPVKAEIRLEVSKYEQANTYIFPVRGTWYVASSGDALSGHRWQNLSRNR